MTNDLIRDHADMHATLDALLASHGRDGWDRFYVDRARPCPFFTAAPCESLAAWVG